MLSRPQKAGALAGLLSVLILAAPGQADAQTAAAPGPAVLQGKVVTNTGQPAAGTRVRLEELNLETTTDAAGVFRFAIPQAGDFTISAVSARHGSSVRRARLDLGQVAEILISLDIAVHLEEVTVTANPEGRRLADVAQPVTVLSGRDLQSARQATLGETLNQEPGMNSTSFGPGASRPIVRGLGADRVRVLEGGLGAGDASSVSPDHAVSLDPLIAERIEVVRGPATLLYGSNAFGGVVNVLDERIPERLTTEPIGGIVDLSYGTAAEEQSGAISLRGAVGPIAWQVRGLTRDASDYEAGDDVEVLNSALDSEEGQAGVSWIGKKGFVGVAFDAFETLYGIPTDELITIDMERDRFDFQAELNTPDAAFRGLRVRATTTDYSHVELEPGGVAGTLFTNDSWEARLEAPHRQLGPFLGTIGLQASSRDFEAIGDEAIVPPSITDNQAVFLLEEFGPQQARFSIGGRYEEQTVEVTVAPDRDFEAVSVSGGFIWNHEENFAIAVSLSSIERPPTAEELYIDGAHPATAQFEIGDPNLDIESGVGADLALRKLSGRLKGELSLFANQFDDFIFLQDTGALDPDSGFPIRVYTQQDAEFRGAELHADIELWHADPKHLDLELLADTVRAENRITGEPLPFIPPWRAGLGIHYQGQRFWWRVEGRHVAEQDRVAPNETPTDSYTLLQAAGGVRLIGHDLVHEIMLIANNITDELARNHVSPLKDFAPLPGRDVRLSYRLIF